MCPLFEQLVDYGFSSLIPDDIDVDPRENQFLEEEVENRKSKTDCFGRVYEDDDSFNEETEVYDEEHDEWFEREERPEYSFVDDFQSMFDDFCYTDQEEFLNMNLWELIGITKKQLALVPWKEVPDWLFVSFVNAFREDTRKLSLDKRLLYATVDAKTSYRQLAIDTNKADLTEEILAYCERIIDHHSIDDSVHLIQMLSDYYRFYNDAVEMNRRRAEANEPQFDYIMFPKPTHLKDIHDKAFRDHVTMETERQSANKEYLDTRIAGVSSTPDYTRYLFSDDDFVILPVTCQADLTEEGTALNHCVASYGSYMASGSSYIYRIREKENPDTPLYTAEIIPEQIGSTQRPKLNQCYGYGDTTAKTTRLQQFIFKWASEKKFRIACKV